MFGKDKKIKELQREIDTLKSLSSLTENQLKEKLAEKINKEEREAEESNRLSATLKFLAFLVLIWVYLYFKKG